MRVSPRRRFRRGRTDGSLSMTSMAARGVPFREGVEGEGVCSVLGELLSVVAGKDAGAPRESETWASPLRVRGRGAPRAVGRLLFDDLVLLPAGALLLRLDFAQALLPLFDRTALILRVELLRLHIGGELVQLRFEACPLLLELDLFGGKLFQANDIALLLQVEGGDFVAEPAQVLRGSEGRGLGLAQGFLLPAQVLLDLAQGILFGLQGLTMLRQRGFRSGQILGNRRHLLLCDAAALLRLGHIGHGFGVLRRELAQTFLVKMGAAFVPVAFALQLQAALSD